MSTDIPLLSSVPGAVGAILGQDSTLPDLNKSKKLTSGGQNPKTQVSVHMIDSTYQLIASGYSYSC